MSENGGNRVRVVLRWIQIKDNKEAIWDDEGEFRTPEATAAYEEIQDEWEDDDDDDGQQDWGVF